MVENQNESDGIASAWDSLWGRHPEQFGALGKLQERVQYQFQDCFLLYEAMTHRSAIKTPYGRTGGSRHYLPEWESLPWNERIEFLGDSVLSLVISTRLWFGEDHGEDGKSYSEGELSRLRSSLVNEDTLAGVAMDLSLGDCILLSKGEAKQGGRERPALLADTLEALFGAVYLDGGFEAARDVIGLCFKNLLKKPGKALERDSKSRLQEWSQKLFQEAPDYEVLSESGPAHSKEYEVAVLVNGSRLASARGGSKKRASQAAAGIAMQKIESDSSVEEELLLKWKEGAER